MNIEKFTSTKDLEASGKNYIYTEADFDKDTKTICNFCVIQFHVKNNKQVPIIKIDTAHGKPHTHKYYKDNNKTEAFNSEISSKCFLDAQRLIKRNWENNLKLYLRRNI